MLEIVKISFKYLDHNVLIYSQNKTVSLKPFILSVEI